MLNSALLEVLLELLITQVGQKVWARIKDWQPKRDPVPQGTAIQMPRVALIDRQDEKAIIDALLQDSPHLRVLCISGPGGVGKTRLIEHTEILLHENQSDLAFRWGGIIDLYHADFYSVLALQATIIQRLDPDSEFFDEYTQCQQALERRLSQRSPISEAEWQSLSDLFVANFNNLTTVYRAVIALDTLENLVYEPDFIQQLCRIPTPLNAVQHWLQTTLPQLENCVFILACRPHSGIFTQLERAFTDKPEQIERITLDGLANLYSRDLLDELLQETPAEVREFIRQHPNLLHEAHGSPVLLTLLAELILKSPSIDVNELSANRGEKVGIAQWIRLLFSTEPQADRLLFYFALARKGMNTALLYDLELAWDEATCTEQLTQMRQLALVKTRRRNPDLFLHDVLYDLFDQWGPTADELKPWYELIASHYRKRIQQAAHTPGAVTDLSVHLLYYSLQINPRRAFEDIYRRYSEIAIKGRETSFDLQLRNELLRYLRSPSGQKQIASYGPTQREIEQDSAVRWVKRLVVNGQFEEAVAVAEAIVALGPQPYAELQSDETLLTETDKEQHQKAADYFAQEDPLFWGQLLTYYSEALTYLGVDEVRIKTILELAIRLLDQAVVGSFSTAEWLRQRALGRAYNTIGHLMWAYGHYGLAIPSYRQALKHFGLTDLKDEQADTFNNLGYVLLVLGDFEAAGNYISQAREFREEIGQLFPLILSNNTTGLHYALCHQYEWAKRYCHQTLAMATELATFRGVVLARNALGYICRRHGEQWLSGAISKAEGTLLFAQAAEHFVAAERVFAKGYDEPIRYWEMLNETGSLFASWGLLLHASGELEQAKSKYAFARVKQQQARNIAKKHYFYIQEIDSCEDLAKQLIKEGEIDSAQKLLKQTLEKIPKVYILSIGAIAHERPGQGEAYWFMLGKIYQQLAVLHSQKLIQVPMAQRRQAKQRQQVLESVALSAAYFQNYWGNTPLLNENLSKLLSVLQQANISIEMIQPYLQEFEKLYGIDLSVLFQTSGDKL